MQMRLRRITGFHGISFFGCVWVFNSVTFYNKLCIIEESLCRRFKVSLLYATMEMRKALEQSQSELKIKYCTEFQEHKLILVADMIIHVEQPWQLARHISDFKPYFCTNFQFNFKCLRWNLTEIRIPYAIFIHSTHSNILKPQRAP